MTKSTNKWWYFLTWRSWFRLSEGYWSASFSVCFREGTRSCSTWRVILWHFHAWFISLGSSWGLHIREFCVNIASTGKGSWSTLHNHIVQMFIHGFYYRMPTQRCWILNLVPEGHHEAFQVALQICVNPIGHYVHGQLLSRS